MESLKRPWLSPALQSAADDAARLGLYLSQYNSGVSRNPKNGIRIHELTGPEGYADFFKTPHLAHCQNLRELQSWLSGFAAGKDR